MWGSMVIRPFGQRVQIFPLKVILCVAGTLSITLTLLSVANLTSKNQPERGTGIHKKGLERFSNNSSDITLESENGLVQPYMKTIENLRNRISVLEEKLKQLEMKPVSHEKNIEEENQVTPLSDCPFPNLDGYGYCETKLKWMKDMWKSDGCYSDWGVDGSDCSIYKYLSEVERWCPPLLTSGNASVTAKHTENLDTAELRNSLRALYEMLGDAMKYRWIRMRIERMETKWLKAGEAFAAKYKTKWKKKKILLHMGLLSDESGWKIGENAFSGGPLGELVQWSDLMASLYVMGHDLSITMSTQDLKRTFEPYINGASNNCPLRGFPFDLVYIDIRGMQMLRKVAKKKFHLIQCKLRSVDSFGTEPEFNDNRYATRKGLKSTWGKWDMHPKQFNTMFPHTPDNTFLGFVIEQQLNPETKLEKENIALVYGKVDKFWKGKSAFIDAIHNSSLEVHGTVDTSKGLDNVPSYVINHGVLPGDQLQALLRKTKVFVGMGFPYEGPAPLEAIANGAVFLNPIFSKSSQEAAAAAEFYKGKPTSRRPSSQHPYADTFIGSPHVRTVDMRDLNSLNETLKDILSSPQVAPYVPHEFTWLGMIERVAHHVEIQDFCKKGPVFWPPQLAMQVIVSNKSESCSEACTSSHLVCEPTFFFEVNKVEMFDKLSISCEKIFLPNDRDEDSAYPAHKDHMCYRQSNSQIFSCAGHQQNAQRLCPCRDYVHGQVELCKYCTLD